MHPYDQLSENSKVWIYQAERPFEAEQAAAIKARVAAFAQQWVSHNQALKAFGDVYHNQFIVLMVDESQAGASGCSIDTSVHFVKKIEAEFGRDMFNRMIFTFMDGDRLTSVSKQEFANLYQAGQINDETLVFNNLVDTKSAFESVWKVPLRESWHKRMVG